MARPARHSEDAANRIAKDIADNPSGLSVGGWLDGQRTLAKRYQVSGETITRALAILTARGTLEHIPGEGHRIPLATVTPLRRTSADQTRVVGQWRGWHAVCLSVGREPFTESTPREAPIPTAAALLLGVDVGETVIERSRTQGWVDAGVRQPVVLSWTWIHPDVARELPVLRGQDTGPGGLTSRLEDAGRRLRWEDVITARRADASEAKRLGIDGGSPVLDVWRRCWDQDDQIQEVTRRVINPELHELVFRYP